MTSDNMKPSDEAVELFSNGLFCSEAILQAYNRHYRLGLSESALKMATVFGAGLGASKCCCGSLTGAALVLGAIKGRTNPEESIEESFKLTAMLHDRFKEVFKSTCCRVLTRNLEWGAPEHHEYCKRFVKGAAEILEDILSETENKLEKEN